MSFLMKWKIEWLPSLSYQLSGSTFKLLTKMWPLLISPKVHLSPDPSCHPVSPAFGSSSFYADSRSAWLLLPLPVHGLTQSHGTPARVEKAGMQISSQGLSPAFQPLCAGRLTTQLPLLLGQWPHIPVVPASQWIESTPALRKSQTVIALSILLFPGPTFFLWNNSLPGTLPTPAISKCPVHPQRPEAVVSYRPIIIITIQMRNQTQLTVTSSVVSSTSVPAPQWHRL